MAGIAIILIMIMIIPAMMVTPQQCSCDAFAFPLHNVLNSDHRKSNSNINSNNNQHSSFLLSPLFFRSPLPKSNSVEFTHHYSFIVRSTKKDKYPTITSKNAVSQSSLSSSSEDNDISLEEEEEETLMTNTSNDDDDTALAIKNTDIDIAIQNLYAVWDLESSSSSYKNKIIRHAFESSPELTTAFSTSLSKVQTFATNVGRIPKHRLRQMIQYHPTLFANAIQSKHIQSIREITVSEFGWTDSQWKKAQNRCEHSHHRWSRTNVKQVIHLFRTRASHLTDTQIAKIFTSNPQLLGMQSQNLCQTFDFFESKNVGLDSSSLSRMVRMVPTVLTCSVDRKLQPTIEFLKHEVGGSGEWTGWKRIVARYPQCLTHSLENVLRPNASFLQNDVLHLQRLSDVAQIVSLFPPTMWLNPTLIEHKVRYLESSLRLSKQEVRDVIVTFPQVLGLSVERNLMQKFDFFLKDAEMTQEQLKDFVLYQPALLACSLEGRLRPRVQQLQQYSITFGYTPPYLMSLPDDKFQKWYVLSSSRPRCESGKK